MKAKRCCNQICCVRLMYTCESFIIIFSKMLLNPARKEKLYTHALFKYFHNNLRYACMKVSRWCIHKHMHLFTFCCCIWSFKACMTYQLLNSTLFVMASRNSEKVHRVHIGDNTIFLADGYSWYPSGISGKGAMALWPAMGTYTHNIEM